MYGSMPEPKVDQKHEVENEELYYTKPEEGAAAHAGGTDAAGQAAPAVGAGTGGQ